MRALRSAVLLGAVVATGAVWGAWSFSQPSVERQPFVQPTWAAGAETVNDIGDPGCVRGGMALDLIETGRLMKMSMDEVFSLLGRPRQYGPEWSYSLGQCSGYGWHHSDLEVRFDSAGRVVLAFFRHAP